MTYVTFHAPIERIKTSACYHQMSRPTIYCQELADTICARVTDGESVRSICLDEAIPARATVNGWQMRPNAGSPVYSSAFSLPR
jgi:hypothetical protein